MNGRLGRDRASAAVARWRQSALWSAWLTRKRVGAGALPARLKLAGGRRKIVLKRLAANYLPRGIVERQKHGFAVPIGALIRTLLRERCADLLLSRTNPVAQWFERSAIEHLLDEHHADRHDHGKKLWALTMLFRVAEPRFAPPVAEPRAAAAAW